MKKIIITTFLLIGLIIQSKAQTTEVNSLTKEAKAITASIFYSNNPIILTRTVRDNPVVRAFPSINTSEHATS